MSGGSAHERARASTRGRVRLLEHDGCTEIRVSPDGTWVECWVERSGIKRLGRPFAQLSQPAAQELRRSSSQAVQSARVEPRQRLSSTRAAALVDAFDRAVTYEEFKKQST